MWVVNFLDLFNAMMNVKVSARSIYDFTDKNPYRSLYIAVIVQALLDASKPEEKYESNESKEIRNEAHSWFFEYAGFESTEIRKFAFKVINSGESEDGKRTIISSLIY